MTAGPAFRDPGEPRTSAFPSATVGDFEISETDERFVWAGEPRPGLPLMHWPGGSICEPIYVWFAHSVAAGRVLPSSLFVEAYALRGWLAWLWRRGIRWDRPTDQLVREWKAERSTPRTRDIGKARHAGLSKRQVERAASIVFGFYSGLPEAMLLGVDFKRYPDFVGPVGSVPAFPLTSRIIRIETRYGSVERRSWRWAGRVPIRRVRRATPGGTDVARLLEHLRGRAAAKPTCRRTWSAQARQVLECERNWLMARCMAEGGLRAEEVASLLIEDLDRALAVEGAPGLSAACDPVRGVGDRARLTARLDTLDRQGRRVVEVEITCKGSTRAAPFPIPLVRDLMSIGLWAVREAALGMAGSVDHGSGPVFVSSKTRKGLTPGAVSDIIQDGFKAILVASSGHRLRAYYGEELALTLLRERMALNGGVVDESVETWVLRRVADAMGHASAETTARHYVDRALLRLARSAGGAPSSTERARMYSDLGVRRMPRHWPGA